MKQFKFIKEEDNKWYVVLPEWEGSKEDLEMVCGADTLLDIVSQSENLAYLTISEIEEENIKFKLEFDKEEADGAWYNLSSEYYNFELWLCKVLKYVYGYNPKILYLY